VKSSKDWKLSQFWKKNENIFTLEQNFYSLGIRFCSFGVRFRSFRVKVTLRNEVSFQKKEWDFISWEQIFKILFQKRVKIYHSHLRVKSFLCVLKIGSILTPKDLESIIILYFTILFFAFYSIHVGSLSHYIYAKFKYYNFFIWLKILKLLERITKNFSRSQGSICFFRSWQKVCVFVHGLKRIYREKSKWIFFLLLHFLNENITSRDKQSVAVRCKRTELAEISARLWRNSRQDTFLSINYRDDGLDVGLFSFN